MKKAFTLIELLVVIAIIAILAALLMPALSRAREEAQKTKCRSNVHNAGISFQLFTTDHDGVYPGYVAKNGVESPDVADEAVNDHYWVDLYTEAKPFVRSTGGGPYWQLVDGGYAGDVDIFDCPSADNPTWGQWAGPVMVGDGKYNSPYPDPTENDHLERVNVVEWAEYAYDLGRVSRNSVAGRIFYGDSWARKHPWGSGWGYWPYNHKDGSNAVSTDQAVQWCPLIDGSILWSDTVPPKPSRGILHQDPPLISEAGNYWDRHGWIPNPRMDEDVHRLDIYNRNGVGGGNLTQQMLESPEDRDDIYAIEGYSGDHPDIGAGVLDPWMHSLVGNPTVPFGHCDNTDSSSAVVNTWICQRSGEWVAEPSSWWPETRSIAYWAERRFHPEIGPFANEGRWDTHDARLIPLPTYLMPPE